MASTARRPATPMTTRPREVSRWPSPPAVVASTRCQAAEATPTPTAKAAAAGAPRTDSAPTMAANETIVSGLAAVIATNLP